MCLKCHCGHLKSKILRLLSLIFGWELILYKISLWRPWSLSQIFRIFLAWPTLSNYSVWICIFLYWRLLTLAECWPASGACGYQNIEVLEFRGRNAQYWHSGVILHQKFFYIFGIVMKFLLIWYVKWPHRCHFW